MHVALRVFSPTGFCLKVHEVSVALPSAPLRTGAVGSATPSIAANVIDAPLTGLPSASVTITEGGGITGVPASAIRPSVAATISIFDGSAHWNWLKPTVGAEDLFLRRYIREYARA